MAADLSKIQLKGMAEEAKQILGSFEKSVVAVKKIDENIKKTDASITKLAPKMKKVLNSDQLEKSAQQIVKAVSILSVGSLTGQYTKLGNEIVNKNNKMLQQFDLVGKKIGDANKGMQALGSAQAKAPASSGKNILSVLGFNELEILQQLNNIAGSNSFSGMMEGAKAVVALLKDNGVSEWARLIKSGNFELTDIFPGVDATAPIVKDFATMRDLVLETTSGVKGLRDGLRETSAAMQDLGDRSISGDITEITGVDLKAAGKSFKNLFKGGLKGIDQRAKNFWQYLSNDTSKNFFDSLGADEFNLDQMLGGAGSDNAIARLLRGGLAIFDNGKGLFDSLSSKLPGVPDALKNIFGFITEGGWLEKLGLNNSPLLKGIQDLFSGLLGGDLSLDKIFGDLGQLGSGLGNLFKSIFGMGEGGWLESIKNAFASLTEGEGGIFGFFGKLKPLFDELCGAAGNFGEAFSGLWDKLGDIFSTDFFGQVFDSIGNFFKDFDTNAFNGILESFGQLGELGKGLGDSFKNLSSTFMQFIQTGKLEFSSLVDSMLADLARLAMQQAAQGIMSMMGGGMMGGGMMGGGMMGGGMMGGGMMGGLFHTGGLAGSYTASSRYLPTGIFSSATRYHGGGIAGLRSDEVPAVLQRGEEVLTRDDPRHRYNNYSDSASGPVNIKVIDQRGAGAPPVEMEQTPSTNGGLDITMLIRREVVNTAASGGLDNVARNRWGLKALPVGR